MVETEATTVAKKENSLLETDHLCFNSRLDSDLGLPDCACTDLPGNQHLFRRRIRF